jgi:hypothetical protein
MRPSLKAGLPSKSGTSARAHLLPRGPTPSWTGLTSDLPGHSLRPQDAPSVPEPWQASQRTNGLAVAALVCGIGQLGISGGQASKGTASPGPR